MTGQTKISVEQKRWLAIAFLLCAAVAVAVVGVKYYLLPTLQSAGATPAGMMPHQDHRPKHGGTFFMATDNIHHLEGVLVRPGTFRVYLYDAFTQPLSTEGVQATSGVVEIGDPPTRRVSMRISGDGKTLEADIGSDVEFPITLTLLLRFPGFAPDENPELFTFPFSHYSNAN